MVRLPKWWWSLLVFIGTLRQADGPDSRGLRTTDLHDPLTGILSGSAPNAQSSEQEAIQ